MRVCKSQCSIFKELCGNITNVELEKETKVWMEEHKRECQPCREWWEANCKSDFIELDEERNRGVVKESKIPTNLAMAIMLFGACAVIFITMFISMWS